MSDPVNIKLFFNFRSPYCYLATRSMFRLIDNYDAKFEWRVLGGWNGRSEPERAAKKIHIARQDGKRWADRLGIFKFGVIVIDQPEHRPGGQIAVRTSKIKKQLDVYRIGHP